MSVFELIHSIFNISNMNLNSSSMCIRNERRRANHDVHLFYVECCFKYFKVDAQKLCKKFLVTFTF